MHDIPIPPSPMLETQLAYGISIIAVIAGLALVLWGRTLHRAFLGLAGAAIGLAAAPYFSEQFHIEILTTRIGCMLVLAIIGIFLARIIWAVFTGAVLAFFGCLVLLRYYLPTLSEESRPVFEAAAESFSQWINEFCLYARSGFEVIWPLHQLVILISLLLVIGLAATVGFMKIKPVSIYCSSFLGAVAIVFGLILAGTQLSSAVWVKSWRFSYVPVALITATVIIGLVFQSRSEAAAAAAREEAEKAKEKEAQKDETKADKKAEKE